MATESFVIESALSVADAFALVVDLTKVNEWDRGVSNAQHVSGEPATVGATYDVTVTGFDGKPTTASYALMAVDAPNSFTMVGSHPQFRADDTITFEPTDSGCRVSYDAGLVLLGEDRPLTDKQLDGLFASIAAVPQAGLQDFLNP